MKAPLERPPNVASEAVWSGLARGEEHRLRRGRPALRQLDERPAVDRPAARRRGSPASAPGPWRVGGGRKRGLPAEQLGLHDLLEVLQARAAVARVEQHLEQHAGGHALEEVAQLVVDDDRVAVPLVALLPDVVAGEGLVEVVRLVVAARLVRHLRAVAREGEDDVVARLGRVDELVRAVHDGALRGGGVGAAPSWPAPVKPICRRAFAMSLASLTQPPSQLVCGSDSNSLIPTHRALRAMAVPSFSGTPRSSGFDWGVCRFTPFRGRRRVSRTRRRRATSGRPRPGPPRERGRSPGTSECP